MGNIRTADHNQDQIVPGRKMSLYRVMLVEDDFDDQFFATQELKRSKRIGKVQCFANGKSLLQYLNEQLQQNRNYLSMAPTAIVLDLDMPLMNGFETLRELKTNPALKEIPVIVVTGEKSRWEIEKASSFKVDGVFQKPLDMNKLRKFFEDGWQWPWQGLWE